MDRTTAAVFGALVGLTPLANAQASSPAARPPDPYGAASYAELLAPVPDAVARLRAADAVAPTAEIEPANAWVQFQFGAPPPFYYGPPPPPPPPAYYGYGYTYPYPAPYFHHHHHHHHHWGT